MIVHEHREPTRADFEGKTIARFEGDACNVWRFWFTDGTAFAIQCEASDGLPFMERCDVCFDKGRGMKPDTLQRGDSVVTRLHERHGVIVTVYDDLHGIPHCVVERPHRIQHIYVLTQVRRAES